MGEMSNFEIFRSAEDMRNFSRKHRAEGKLVALVPTMGFLHEGHLSLVQAAREKAQVVVASIYVNPTQFSKNEDFGAYPRNAAADIQHLQDMGCDAVFEPASLYASASGSDDGQSVVGVSEHRPGAHETFVQVEQLQRGLCGVSRPHFFRGVATVVAKLFNIVEPDFAMFGRKDYQQWRVICRMVRDLDFAVEVVGLPIVRHTDGLAMSSRNALLTPEHRRQASCIYQALQWAQAAVADRTMTSAAALGAEVSRQITEGGGRVDYVQVVDAEELLPVRDASQQPTLVAVAAFFGRVRLIDNIVLST